MNKRSGMKHLLFIACITYTLNIYGQAVSGVLAERIYLQTDKQLYLAGECIYFKIFTVTPEKKPLSFSKIAYVELLDNADARVQIKVELTRGVGDGWMELPLDLPTGYYRLAAYTRFMRNEGETVFFEKTIAVVNTFLPRQVKYASSDSVATVSEHTEQTSNCSLLTDKTTYATREKGMVKLEGLPENIHTLSLSIAGKAPMTVQENSIIQWAVQIQAAPAAKPLLKYISEYEGHIISGKIIPLQNPANDANNTWIPLLSFTGNHVFLFEGQKDGDNVSFYTTQSAGITEMAITSYGSPESAYRIDLQSPFAETHEQKQLPVLTGDSIHLDGLLERTVALQTLSSFTKDSLTTFRSDDRRFDLNLSKTYILDEWTRFTEMSDLMIEFISQLRFRRNDEQKRELQMLMQQGNDFFWSPTLVVLDGIPIMDHEIIYGYNPLLVERINIYQQKCVFGGINFDGIAEFLTYDRKYPGLSIGQSTQVVVYAGTQPPRLPYSPNYSDEKNRQSRVPDFRHTLLWEPMLQSKGKSAIEIQFYTSDLTGEFTVTVEGLSDEGDIIYKTAQFRVR